MNIDDEVLKRAKRAAAEEEQTLGELMTDALRLRLKPPSTDEEPFQMVTDGEGGPRPGVDISNNAAVRDVMDGLDTP